MRSEADARDLLEGLVGKTVYTLAHRKPNRILRIEEPNVIVATKISPNGKRVAIAEVQAALDQLLHRRSVIVDVPTLGHRSSFIGAVLATIPGAEAQTRPLRISIPPGSSGIVRA